MRIGVVCEGATDYITISKYLTASLKKMGVDAEFIDLHPGLDKTSELNSGWSNALLWLERNPLKSRRNNILGSGLFSGSLAYKKCDIILLQLDCDCLDDKGFENYLLKRGLNIHFSDKNWENKHQILKEILLKFSELSEETCPSERHLICCAAHNSESWCIGALLDSENTFVEDIDLNTTNQIFLERLSQIEGAVNITSERRLKSRRLREIFCDATLVNIDRVEKLSRTYRNLVYDANAINSD